MPIGAGRDDRNAVLDRGKLSDFFPACEAFQYRAAIFQTEEDVAARLRLPTGYLTLDGDLRQLGAPLEPTLEAQRELRNRELENLRFALEERYLRFQGTGVGDGGNVGDSVGGGASVGNSAGGVALSGGIVGFGAFGAT